METAVKILDIASENMAKESLFSYLDKGIDDMVKRCNEIMRKEKKEKTQDKEAKNAKAFLSVEMSMGQMVEDVRLAVNGEKPVYFYGRNGGVVPSPDEICAEIEKIIGGGK